MNLFPLQPQPTASSASARGALVARDASGEGALAGASDQVGASGSFADYLAASGIVSTLPEPVSAQGLPGGQRDGRPVLTADTARSESELNSLSTPSAPQGEAAIVPPPEKALARASFAVSPAPLAIGALASLPVTGVKAESGLTMQIGVTTGEASSGKGLPYHGEALPDYMPDASDADYSASKPDDLGEVAVRLPQASKRSLHSRIEPQPEPGVRPDLSPPSPLASEPQQTRFALTTRSASQAAGALEQTANPENGIVALPLEAVSVIAGPIARPTADLAVSQNTKPSDMVAASPAAAPAPTAVAPIDGAIASAARISDSPETEQAQSQGLSLSAVKNVSPTPVQPVPDEAVEWDAAPLLRAVVDASDTSAKTGPARSSDHATPQAVSGALASDAQRPAPIASPHRDGKPEFEIAFSSPAVSSSEITPPQPAARTTALSEPASVQSIPPSPDVSVESDNFMRAVAPIAASQNPERPAPDLIQGSGTKPVVDRAQMTAPDRLQREGAPVPDATSPKSFVDMQRHNDARLTVPPIDRPTALLKPSGEPFVMAAARSEAEATLKGQSEIPSHISSQVPSQISSLARPHASLQLPAQMPSKMQPGVSLQDPLRHPEQALSQTPGQLAERTVPQGETPSSPAQSPAPQSHALQSHDLQSPTLQSPALQASTLPPGAPPVTPAPFANAIAQPQQIAPSNPALADALEQVTGQIAEAREAGRSLRPEFTMRHSEFGAVAMRLEPASASGDWRATLSARDPGFIPAVHTALTERSVAAVSESGLGSNASGSNNSGQRSGENGQNGSQQSSGQSSWQSAGSQAGMSGEQGANNHRYGSSPGSGQASAKPYSGEEASDGSSTGSDRGPDKAVQQSGVSDLETGKPLFA